MNNPMNKLDEAIERYSPHPDGAKHPQQLKDWNLILEAAKAHRADTRAPSCEVLKDLDRIEETCVILPSSQEHFAEYQLSALKISIKTIRAYIEGEK